MKVTIIGTVARLGEEKSCGGDFRRRELVVNEGGDASRPLPVEFAAGQHGPDRLAQLLALAPGDLVRVEAALSAREWEGRLYLRLQGLRAERGSFSDAEAELPPHGAAAPAAPKDAGDLPF